MPYTYDDDFLGCYYNAQSDDLEDALEDLPDPDIIKAVRETCVRKGITAANAMITYTDAELQVPGEGPVPAGLPYIGCFDWS